MKPRINGRSGPAIPSSELLSGKTILLTGGTGTFGKAITSALLRTASVKEVRIFSRNETRQTYMQQNLGDPRLTFYIGDVQDAFSLRRAVAGVDILIHAAAMKHVPVCERDPFEAVQTNVIGTMNVIRAAIDLKIGTVIGLSTDKAVQPINLYGATKLICERLITRASTYDPARFTRFVCLRYGNVAGSNGSVVELFRIQKANGSLRITHPEMTRFWITQNEVASFVLASLRRAQGGEVFVPKLPSVRLLDLADAIAPKVPRKIIGIRPGEKLHETLITENESERAVEYPDHFILYAGRNGRPASKPVSSESGAAPVPSPARFQYSSDKNSWWLTRRQIRSLLHTPSTPVS